MWEWYTSLYSNAMANNNFYVGLFFCLLYLSATFGFFLGIFFFINAFLADAKKKRKGRKFENKAKRKLEDKFHVTVYQGLLFPKGFDDTTELDLAFVSSKGLFCFECKFRDGYSFTCRPLQPTWFAYYSGNNTETMNNPLFQNKLHISALLERLPKDYFNRI